MLPPDDDVDPEPPAHLDFEVIGATLFVALIILVLFISGLSYLAAFTPTP